MRKLSITIALVIVAIVALYGLAAAQDSAKVTMNALNNSGQTGSATLTARGNQTEVVVDIKGGAAGVAQPAHIHAGKCPNVAEVKFPLTNVVDGKSTTMVNATLKDLQAGNMAVNVHRSAQEISTYVSCGDIQVAAATTPAAPATQPAPGAQPAQPAQPAPGALPRTGDDTWPVVSAVVVIALAILGLGFVLRGRTA